MTGTQNNLEKNFENKGTLKVSKMINTDHVDHVTQMGNSQNNDYEYEESACGETKK